MRNLYSELVSGGLLLYHSLDLDLIFGVKLNQIVSHGASVLEREGVKTIAHAPISSTHVRSHGLGDYKARTCLASILVQKSSRNTLNQDV